MAELAYLLHACPEFLLHGEYHLQGQGRDRFHQELTDGLVEASARYTLADRLVCHPASNSLHFAMKAGMATR